MTCSHETVLFSAKYVIKRLTTWSIAALREAQSPRSAEDRARTCEYPGALARQFFFCSSYHDVIKMERPLKSRLVCSNSVAMGYLLHWSRTTKGRRKREISTSCSPCLLGAVWQSIPLCAVYSSHTHRRAH